MIALFKSLPSCYLWAALILVLGIILVFLLCKWLDNVPEEPKCGCGSGKYVSNCDCWRNK